MQVLWWYVRAYNWKLLGLGCLRGPTTYSSNQTTRVVGSSFHPQMYPALRRHPQITEWEIAPCRRSCLLRDVPGIFFVCSVSAVWSASHQKGRLLWRFTRSSFNDAPLTMIPANTSLFVPYLTSRNPINQAPCDLGSYLRVGHLHGRVRHLCLRVCCQSAAQVLLCIS